MQEPIQRASTIENKLRIRVQMQYFLAVDDLAAENQRDRERIPSTNDLAMFRVVRAHLRFWVTVGKTGVVEAFSRVGGRGCPFGFLVGDRDAVGWLEDVIVDFPADFGGEGC